MKTILALIISATISAAQSTGDYVLTRKAATGYTQKLLAPETGKALGWDSSGNPVNIAPVSSLAWDVITSKPSTFAPSSHTHPLSELSQSAATTGQVATWNGSAWAPATPSGITANTDFSLTQNSVASFSSVNSGAVVDTLKLVGGNVLIGKSSVTSGTLTFDAYKAATGTITQFGSNLRVDWTPSATTSSVTNGSYNQLYSYGSNDLTGIGSLRGVVSSVTNKGDANVYEINGFITHVGNQTTTSGKLLTLCAGYKASTPAASATQPITSSYGFYAEKQSGTGIASGFGFYQADTGDLNYFAGKLGVGYIPTHADNTRVTFNQTQTANTTDLQTFNVNGTYTPASNASGSFSSIMSQTIKTGSSTAALVIGQKSNAYNNGGGTVSDLRVFAADGWGNLATSTLTSASGLRISTPTASASAAITSAHGVYISAITATGITNAYGIYQAGASDKNVLSGQTGIGGSPNANAILDLQSTTKAFLLPRMTKTQRDAVAPPAAGMAVYQTDNTPGLRVYNGTNWMRYTETAD